jgi:hypothetical protein
MKVVNHPLRNITNLGCIFLSNSLNRIEHFIETGHLSVRNHLICQHASYFPGRTDSVELDFSLC